MTIGTTGKTRFTCLNLDDRFVSVKAENLYEADKKIDRDGILIIQGKASDIGATRVKEVGRDLWFAEEVEEGSLCTITVGDPVMIRDAIYLGLTDDLIFASFSKNGILFWVEERELYFHSVEAPTEGAAERAQAVSQMKNHSRPFI